MTLVATIAAYVAKLILLACHLHFWIEYNMSSIRR